jgi:hypothetical protein
MNSLAQFDRTMRDSVGSQFRIGVSDRLAERSARSRVCSCPPDRGHPY